MQFVFIAQLEGIDMGVYTRFKKAPDGLRALVELLETTPMSRRKKMIDVGMLEDPAYTEKALQLVLTFKDILAMPDLELAEVVHATPPELVGFAIHSASEEIQDKFLNMAPPRAIGAI